MRGRVQSGLAAAVIAMGVIAPMAVVPAPPPTWAADLEIHDVRLAAAAPPLGAIPLAFIRNQFQYCSVICPHVVEGLVTVPAALVMAPVTFLGALGATGSPLRAIGAAAASVTGPANAAVTGIIENDVYRVVPKAFNNLEVAVVELVNVASAVLRPDQFLRMLDTARANILTALNQPLPPPVPTETGARTLPQVLAVETIRVFAAVAFQAGEILLLGVVRTADAAAQELAVSGDPFAAVAAGTATAAESLSTAGRIVHDAADTAVTNVRAALANPFPRNHSEPESDVEPETTETSRPTPSAKPRTPAQVLERIADFDDDPPATDQVSSADSSATSADGASTTSPDDSSTVAGRSDGSDATDENTSSDNATPSATKNAMNNDPPR